MFYIFCLNQLKMLFPMYFLKILFIFIINFLNSNEHFKFFNDFNNKIQG